MHDAIRGDPTGRLISTAYDEFDLTETPHHDPPVPSVHTARPRHSRRELRGRLHVGPQLRYLLANGERGLADRRRRSVHALTLWALTLLALTLLALTPRPGA